MLQEKTIRYACKQAMNNIYSEGVTDVALIDKPFESIYYKKESPLRKIVIDLVTSRILKNSYEELKLGPLNHILIPKKQYADYRDCALVDILDETIYLTLVLSIARVIEKKRSPVKDNRVLSYRIRIDEKTGDIFNPSYTYDNFAKRIASLKESSSFNVLASCDIAHFYDRLNLHRLNSVLSSIPEIDPDIVNLINEVLLFWSNRNSYGLPVGSNASRILAEAELIEVDNYLVKHGVCFCRFVDDYKIFGSTAKEVDEGVSCLVKALRREGLFLNPSKTKLSDISNYSREERNKEHFLLNGRTTESNDKDTTRPRLIVTGYSGIIPLRFRSPSEVELDSLKRVDIDDLIKTLQKSPVINEGDYKTLLRAIHVKQRFDVLVNAVKLIDRTPQFIPYVVDFLIKHADSIDERYRAKISDYFENTLSEGDVLPYKLVALARLFSTSQFQNMQFVVNAYLNVSRSVSGEVGRLLLQSVGNRLSRLEALEIRDCANSVSGISELRMLAKVVLDNLPSDECRPFLKNLSIRTGDPFLKMMSKKGSKTSRK